MDIEESRRVVSNDVRRERLHTVLAAFLTGAIVLPLLVAPFAHNVKDALSNMPPPFAVSIAAIMLLFIFLAMAFLPIGILALLYQGLRPYDSRLPLLREVGLWVGLLTSAPISIIYPPFAFGPWLALHSRLGYQGRFKLTSALDNLGDYACRRCPAFLKYRVAIHRAEIAFHSGNYQSALEKAQRASTEAGAEYEKDHSENNLVSLICVDSTRAALLCVHGQVREGALLMESLISQRESIDRLPLLQQVQAFSSLAEGFVRVGQPERALSFSELADSGYKILNKNLPPLAGCIATHWALAALDLGLLDLAEEQARASQRHWGELTTKTGERQADSYYVLGRVALARGQYDRACTQLSLAIAIRQIRNGQQYPELAPLLQYYRESLIQLGQASEAEDVQTELHEIRGSHPPGARLHVKKVNADIAKPGLNDKAQ